MSAHALDASLGPEQEGTCKDPGSEVGSVRCDAKAGADESRTAVSPFMKAAVQIMEARESKVPDNLTFDPLTMSSGSGRPASADTIELPTELMMNLVGPGIAAAARNARPLSEAPLAPSQERARRRLQQRKEAAAREAAQKAEQALKDNAEEPLDESWIDKMEQKSAKKKAGQAKAAAARKERKKAKKGETAQKEVPAEPDAVEEESDDEEEMAALEAQEAQLAAQREAEHEAEREAERQRQAKEAEAKAREEMERMEQEMLQRAEEQRQAEQRRKAQQEAERQRKEEEQKRRKDNEEKQKKKKEAEQRRKKESEQTNSVDKQEAAQRAELSELAEEAKAQQEAEQKSKRGGRDKKAEPKVDKAEKSDQQATNDGKEALKEGKLLRQSLTPSQLRRQQRKRQRQAQREAAEAAAREEGKDESGDDEEEDEEAKAEPLAAQPEKGQKNERQNKQKESKETRHREGKAEKAEQLQNEGWRAKGEEAKKELVNQQNEALRSSSAAPADVCTLVAANSQAWTIPDEDVQDDQRSEQRSRRDRTQSQVSEQELLQQQMGITTLMISQIPEHVDAECFRQQLDSWGLIGTYNFFYMPPEIQEWGGRCAFINFADQAVAAMCQSFFAQWPTEGVATPFHVQGLENNISHWSQYVGAGDMVNGPLIIPTPTPSAWAVNGAQALMNAGKFSPQIRGQFHKTKMCAFHKKKKCSMGINCPFAHSKDELHAPPDLSKTKLCVNFFRKRCNDANCKFAHGHAELRATGSVYKTELCRAWSQGSCKAGDTCRYAHGVEELRDGGGLSSIAASMDYMGYSEDDYMSMQMGVDGYGGLTGIWENEAAAMQQFSGYSLTSMSSSPSRGEPVGQELSSGQPQEGTIEIVNDGASDMGLSDVSTLCPADGGKITRQQTAPARASVPSERPRLRQAQDSSSGSSVVLRVKGTFMESVFLDEELEKMPVRRSWSEGDLAQLQEMDGDAEAQL